MNILTIKQMCTIFKEKERGIFMDTKKALTERQQEIFDYIRSCTERGKMPPTVREIGDKFGISSTNGVRSILAALIKKGYIRRAPRLSRGIEILEESENSLQETQETSESSTVEVPIIGRVAAGAPILAVQNIEGTVTVDRDFLASQPNVFALHVKGDSMINAGIFDGDLVFARSQTVAERGEMIIAQVDDEATVKYYQPQIDHIELRPANPKYQPIIVHSNQKFSIAGRVIGVLRKIN